MQHDLPSWTESNIQGLAWTKLEVTYHGSFFNEVASCSFSAKGGLWLHMTLVIVKVRKIEASSSNML